MIQVNVIIIDNKEILENAWISVEFNCGIKLRTEGLRIIYHV